MELAQDISDVAVSVWRSFYRCVVFGGVAGMVLGVVGAHGELVDYWFERVVCVWEIRELDSHRTITKK